MMIGVLLNWVWSPFDTGAWTRSDYSQLLTTKLLLWGLRLMIQMRGSDCNTIVREREERFFVCCLLLGSKLLIDVIEGLCLHF
jgi:hypothetical protein